MADYSQQIEQLARTTPSPTANINLTLGVQSSPDEAAENNALAQRFGVSPDTIAADKGMFKQQAQATDAQVAVQSAPRTQDWLAKNQQNAKVAHDDVGVLSSIESAVGGLGSFVQSGLFSIAGGIDRAIMDDTPATVAVPNVIRYAPNAFAQGVFTNVIGGVASAARGIEDVGENFDVTAPLQRRLFGGTVENAFSNIFRNTATAANNLGNSFAPPDTGSYVTNQILGGVANLPGTLLALGTGIGGKALGLSDKVAAFIGAATGGVQQGGQSYQTARDEGLDVGPAALYGLTDAATETGGEYLGEHSFLKATSEGKSVLTRFLKSQIGEQVGEQFSTISQDFSAWVALPENKTKSFGDFLGQLPEDMLSTAIQTAVVGGLSNATISAAEHVANSTGYQARVEAARAAAAQQHADALQGILNAAGNSALRERDPVSFQDFMQSATEETPLEHVYVDGQALHQVLQSDPSAGAALAAKLPSVQDQLQQAVDTGGDVRIPVSELATALPGDVLEQSIVDNLRVDPLLPSAAEAREKTSAATEALNQQFEEQLRTATADDAFTASRDNVTQSFVEKLDNANRFNADTNRQYASLLGNFYATQAARLGISPEDMLKAYPLDIRAVDEAKLKSERQLDQAKPAPGVVSTDQTEKADAPGRRGYIQFVPGNPQAHTPVITLLNASDLSTFLHESGHFFLEVTSHMASQKGAPAAIQSDMDAALKWFGIPEGKNGKPSRLEVWNGMSFDKKRQYHEQYARGFEAYLFEGKAPSSTLRGVFQRFRQWLVAVYRDNIKNLNVQLSPTIRGVFDRLVASEEAIKEAQAEGQQAPLWTSKPAGMTDVEWEEYQALGENATNEAVGELATRSIRDMRFAKRSHDAALREQQKSVAGIRQQIEDEVRGELSSQPVYRTLDFLKRGLIDGVPVEGPHKLSLPEMRAQYQLAEPDFFKSLGYGKYGLLAEDGIHPQQVAEMFGYGSIDEMIREIRKAPKFSEALEAGTDQRMLERYGDITSPTALDNAASEAIHNDVRARFVATELKALGKSGAATRELTKAAKQYAQAVINRLLVRNVHPAQYEAAERRAGAAAFKAVQKGDLLEATRQKRNQLINLYATRAARQAQRDVDRALDYFRRLSSAKARQSIDRSYMDQIDKLLERFSFRPATNTAIDQRASLVAWIDSQREHGFEPALDPRLEDEARRVHYKNLTVDEMLGLRDSIKNIEHLGRLKDKLLKNKEERDLNTLVTNVKDSLDTFAYKTVKQPVGARSWVEKFKAGAGGFFASLRKFSSLTREMDGNKDGGAMWSALSRPMNEATEDEALRLEDAYTRMKNAFANLKGENTARREYEPAIDRAISLEDRLGMALNWGNDLNRQRLMDGHGYTQAQVEAVLAKLKENHWAFVKETWANINAHKADIQAQLQRINGVEPKWQDATSFTIQGEDGNVYDLPGGYYPIKYDLDKSIKADQDNDAEIARQQLYGAHTAAMTKRGFLKERVERVQGRPMRLDFNVISQHHREVIHDLAWRETLIDVNRIMRRLSPNIREHYGPEIDRAMRATIRDVAAGRLGAESAGDRIFEYLRSGVTVAGIGWNIYTGLFHLTGVNNAMIRIGPKYFARGMAHIAGDAAKLENTAKWVEEQSDYMRLRRVQRGTNLTDITQAVTPNMLGFTSDSVPGYTQMKQTLNDSYHMFINRALVMTSIPTWAGAYEKAIDEGNFHDRAVKLADQAVRDSHSSNFAMDKSGIERERGIMRLFTSFYMWFNTTYNQLAESAINTRRVGVGGVPALARDFLLFSLSGALLAAVHGLVDGDDWKKFRGELIADQVTQYMSLIPILREIAPTVGSAIGTDTAYDYSGPAGTSAIAAANDLVRAYKTGKQSSEVEAANRLGGIIFHYPAAQVSRTSRGIMALADGKTHNPLAVFLGPPRKKR
jgi:hypothetical protein